MSLFHLFAIAEYLRLGDNITKKQRVIFPHREGEVQKHNVSIVLAS